MSAPEDQNSKSGTGMFGASTAALRKVIGSPLKRGKTREPKSAPAFNSSATHDPMAAVLEGDIIPRLMMAHLVDGSTRPIEEHSEIDSEDTDRFVNLSLRLEAPRLLEEVDRYLEQGVSVEEILLELLAPAARHLGEMWSGDECDFVDVTMGLWRLQEIMREVSLRSAPVLIGHMRVRSALFCPIPGDVHSFGAQMIEEIFARAGWQSEVLLRPERRELLDYLAHNPIDLLGLTVSRDCPAAALSSLLKAVRSVAANPNLKVMIGGHAIIQNPSLVAEVGADGTGIDAKDALKVAEELVSEPATHTNPMV